MAKDRRTQGAEYTVAEAGRKGGRTTANKYGPEFYSAIGKKGGRLGGTRRAALIAAGKRALAEG